MSILTDSVNDFTYKNTVTPEFTKAGKPKGSWMTEWTQAERIDKFVDFCKAFDKREDTLLREDYQIFSHRLHWHEHPYCWEMQEVTDSFDQMWYTLLFSFSNEHWLTFKTLKDHGEDALRQRFVNQRAARSDLFQIYYPKGTIVKDWLIDGTKEAAAHMHKLLLRNERWTMMGIAKELAQFFVEHQGFRNPMYPCKNFARYIAMSYPEKVNPNTWLFGGTGHFDGMYQIFPEEKYLFGKAKYDIDEAGMFVPQNDACYAWMNQMEVLEEATQGIINWQAPLNIEDKTCFFYKHIAITHGAKRPTKRIPYEWIFPSDFSLKGVELYGT